MMENLLLVLFLFGAGCHSASVGYSKADLDPANSLKLFVQNTIGFVPASPDCNNYCLNSGTCQLDENGLPYCTCWPGFNGTRCEEQPCDPERYECYNGGNCQYLPYRPPDYAQCVCPEKYTGEHCEVENTCRVENITCSDHGQCINDDTRAEGYICYCEAGHVGDDCEIGDPCTDYECQHGGHCEWQNEPNFLPRCQCEYDYEGPHCETKVECDLDCQNGGICAKDHKNESQCFCPPGWSGETCEKNVCMSKQCYNGGTCIVLDDGKPFCDCIPGYWGDNCEQNKCQGYEECIKEGHHGMCDISKDGEPICQCKPGWTGEFCDEKIIDTTPKLNS